MPGAIAPVADLATIRLGFQTLGSPVDGPLHQTGPVTRVPAAENTLAVLDLLSRRSEPLPAAAIAIRLGLPRSTVYHLLTVLTERGYVVHLPEERRYGLGLAAYELGAAYTRQAPLQRLARPVLARLVDATTHNAHFGVLHGRDVLYVLEERAPGRDLLVTEVGVRLPAHLTASGLAILAALPAAQVRALFPDVGSFSQRVEGSDAPRTLGQLRARLVAVRADGHAREEGTVTAGLSSVAVAVRDHTGHPLGAFAVTYPSVGSDRDREALARATVSAATDLARRLGGRYG